MFEFATTSKSYSYDSLEGSEHSDNDLKLPMHSGNDRSSTLTWCTLIVCVLCTIFNAASLTISPKQPDSPRSLASYTRQEMMRLRRPSQFIGLDSMEKPDPPIDRNFTNFPIVLTQIDENDKTKVFDPDPRKHMTFVGTISPEERRVHVSKGISTIVQFRAVDYDMEICDLELILPQSPVTASEFSQLQLSNRPFSLSLYRLNATLPLDDAALSWSTRPQRVSKLGDVRMAYGASWRRRFSCAWDDVLTFELACTEGSIDEDCSVEWWQDHEDPYPEPAIYITQRSTV